MPITHDQIGSFYFVQLDGDLDPDGQTVEENTRPAVDGRAFRELGERGDETTLFGVALVETSSEAKTIRENYKAIQSTIVSIIRNEQTHTNYLILNVGDFRRQQVGAQAGGVLSDGTTATAATHWLVTSRWTVVYAGT